MKSPAVFIRPDILLLLKFTYIVKGQPIVIEDAQGHVNRFERVLKVFLTVDSIDR